MHQKKFIVGVMGPGDHAQKKDVEAAYELGRRIAQEGWILLSGGRNSGVMDAVSRGAKSAGGLTIGIMPTKKRETISKYVDIAIITEMGSARNSINVLTSDVVAVCGMSAGTASEVALALKADKDIILINPEKNSTQFFKSLNKKNTCSKGLRSSHSNYQADAEQLPELAPYS